MVVMLQCVTLYCNVVIVSLTDSGGLRVGMLRCVRISLSLDVCIIHHAYAVDN